MNREALIEALASKEHERWAHWMRYQFSKCIKNSDGSLTIPAELVIHWKRQIDTPYEKLSEREKQSDRNQVLKILPILEQELLKEERN